MGSVPAPGPELTIAQAAAAREVLLPLVQADAGGAEALALDLCGITDIDSAGVQLLLAARATLQAQGRTLQLVRASAPVREALACLGLLALLAPEGNDTEAVHG